MSERAQEAGQEPHQEVSARTAWLAAAGVFVLLLLIYRVTVMPTVVDQDSGELATVCHVLGVAHPTGYPLWALLGRGFDLLPLGGTTAFRVALLSAFCTAAAGAVLTLLALRLTGQVGAGVFAGLAFGLWFPTWSQAVRAEVYGLTGLLFALALMALVGWESRRSPARLLVLSLACGFVAMHHRTAMLVVLPALVAAVIKTQPRRARLYLGAAALFLTPFGFYAYLPIRAATGPPVNWTNPSTLDRFLDHVMATQYQFFAFSHSAEEMFAVGKALVPEMLAPGIGLSVLLAAIGLPLMIWGWVGWLRRQPVTAISLAAGAGLLCFWVLQWGETSDLKVFFLPLGAVVSVCGALGLARVGKLAPSWQAGRLLIVALGVVLCGGLVRANWERSDVSDVWSHRDRWVAMLSQLEPDAIFVSDFDVPSFVTLYLQNVEGLKEDVTLVRSTRVQDDWYVDSLRDGEVRAAIREVLPEALAGGAEIHEQTALLSYLLAKRLGAERRVYALHGPMMTQTPEPPYFVGRSEDLVEVCFEQPDMLRAQREEAALTVFPGGVMLMGFEWDRDEVTTGEVVGFTARWRVGATPPVGAQFAIGLAPETVDAEQFAEVLRERGRFVQAFPLLYRLRGLAPTPEGSVYEQRGVVIIPSNGPGGTYRTAMGFSQGMPPAYQGWMETGSLQVTAGPLPRNGP